MNKNTYIDQFNYWKENLVVESDKKLLSLLKDEDDIVNSFYKNLEFGTAGARTYMGIGPNRINVYTIRRLTEAYVKFLYKKNNNILKNRNIIVIHDTRTNGQQYLIEVAKILSDHGMNVFIEKNNTDSPTPFGSAMVMHKKAIGCVVISASHNPKEFNGYKVYGNLGEQLLPNDTNIISNYLSEINYDFSPYNSLEDIKKLNYFDDEKDIDYFCSLSDAILLNSNEPKNFKIVFSPVFGTTRKIMPILMRRNNFNFSILESESKLDPTFGNYRILNPEEKSVYSASIKKAQELKADAVFVSDPDGDRIGIAFYNKESKDFDLLSTNKLAILLLKYFIDNKKNIDNYYVFYNNVSSNMIEKIALKNNIKIKTTPVGPKWLANMIVEHDCKNYLFAFEESCGFIISPLLLDKDSFQAFSVFYEIFNHYHNKGMNYNDFYEKHIAPDYGYLYDDRINIILKGSAGVKIMQAFISKLRNDIIKTIAGYNVSEKHDYLNNPNKHLAVNTLKFYFEDKYNWVAVRASGTEPKLKFYINIVDNNKMKAEKMFNDIKAYCKNWADNFSKNFKIPS